MPGMSRRRDRGPAVREHVPSQLAALAWALENLPPDLYHGCWPDGRDCIVGVYELGWRAWSQLEPCGRA
jgi:hypothetical protein